MKALLTYKSENPDQITSSSESSGGRLLAALPTSVDWRTSGAVSPVQDQGSCGCCYAFSSMGALEGIYKIKKGTLYQLAPQQILDCSTAYNYGCNGGTRSGAYKYLYTSLAMTSSSYAYTGV